MFISLVQQRGKRIKGLCVWWDWLWVNPGLPTRTPNICRVNAFFPSSISPSHPFETCRTSRSQSHAPSPFSDIANRHKLEELWLNQAVATYLPSWQRISHPVSPHAHDTGGFFFSLVCPKFLAKSLFFACFFILYKQRKRLNASFVAARLCLRMEHSWKIARLAFSVVVNFHTHGWINQREFLFFLFKFFFLQRGQL